MNGIHEVTGSIPVWSTNLRSRSHAKVALRSCVAAKEGSLGHAKDAAEAATSGVGGPNSRALCRDILKKLLSLRAPAILF